MTEYNVETDRNLYFTFKRTLFFPKAATMRKNRLFISLKTNTPLQASPFSVHLSSSPYKSLTRKHTKHKHKTHTDWSTNALLFSFFGGLISTRSNDYKYPERVIRTESSELKFGPIDRSTFAPDLGFVQIPIIRHILLNYIGMFTN